MNIPVESHGKYYLLENPPKWKRITKEEFENMSCPMQEELNKHLEKINN